MSDFNKDEYLNDLPDADELAGQAAPAADDAKPAENQASDQSAPKAKEPADDTKPEAAKPDDAKADTEGDDKAAEDTLTPLG